MLTKTEQAKIAVQGLPIKFCSECHRPSKTQIKTVGDKGICDTCLGDRPHRKSTQKKNKLFIKSTQGDDNRKECNGCGSEFPTEPGSF